MSWHENEHNFNGLTLPYGQIYLWDHYREPKQAHGLMHHRNSDRHWYYLTTYTYMYNKCSSNISGCCQQTIRACYKTCCNSKLHQQVTVCILPIKSVILELFMVWSECLDHVVRLYFWILNGLLTNSIHGQWSHQACLKKWESISSFCNTLNQHRFRLANGKD